MMRVALLLMAITATAVHAVAPAPTAAPTKKDPKIVELLAMCAKSRGDASSITYTEPEACKSVQEYRKGSYDLRAKLDTLPGKLDFSAGYPTFPTAYSSVFVVLALPGILLAIAGVACCLPCWFAKTCGEATACCCNGTGCYGTCNDYICGCRSQAYPTGWCRWGPVGDYGTFFPFAKFERSADLPDGEPSGCGPCTGTPIELDEGATYHDRDDYFSERKKPMEKRFSIPNFVWLIIIIVCGCVICGVAIGGSVQLKAIIEGVGGAIEQGNCIVEDGLDLVQEINKPLLNISAIATNVAVKMKVTVDGAGDLGATFAAIGASMATLATSATADACGWAASSPKPFSAFPSVKMQTAAAYASGLGTGIQGAAVGVEQMVGMLDMLTMLTGTLNSTLKMAVGAAQKATGGPMIVLLKDTVRPINTKINGYLDQVREVQGKTTTVLFVFIFIICIALIIQSIAWLTATELYELTQKQGEEAINENLKESAPEAEMVTYGEVEASGEEDDGIDEADGVVMIKAEPEDVGEVEAVGTCGDCVCTIFQISSIWSMHVLHFVGWVIMMLTFIAAAFFSPLTVLVSDTCIIVDHVAEHPGLWLNSPSSPVANNTLAVDLVSSCMDVANGNMLVALGIAEQLNIVDKIDLGNGTALDLTSMLNFAPADTNMYTAFAALANADFWASYTVATPVSTSITSKLALFNAALPLTTKTEADCTGPLPDNNGACTVGSMSSSKLAHRDALMKMTMYQCTAAHVAQLSATSVTIQQSMVNFKTRMTTLQNALANAVPDAMNPIQENINALVALGSCAFIRKRMNGALTSVCGTFLGGLTSLAWTLSIIAISFLIMLFIVSNCAIQRFRMYDVACWKHNRTRGCSSAPEVEEGMTASVSPAPEDF